MNEAMEKAFADMCSKFYSIRGKDAHAFMWNASRRHTLEEVLGLQRLALSGDEEPEFMLEEIGKDDERPGLIRVSDIEALKETK